MILILGFDSFLQDELRQQKEEEMDDYCSEVHPFFLTLWSSTVPYP